MQLSGFQTGPGVTAALHIFVFTYPRQLNNSWVITWLSQSGVLEAGKKQGREYSRTGLGISDLADITADIVNGGLWMSLRWDQ